MDKRNKGMLGQENIVIILFEFAALFYNTDKFQKIGYMIILIGTFIMFIDYVINKGTSISAINLSEMILLILVYLIAIIRVPSSRSLAKMLSLLISIAMLIYFSKIDVNRFKLKTQKYVIGIQLFVILIPKVLGSGFNPIDGGYKSIFSTTTFAGLFSCLSIELCILFFILSKEKIWIAYIMIWSYIMWSTKVRTALLGILIIFFLVIAFRYMRRKNKKYVSWLIKWILFIALLAIIIIYPQFDKFSFYNVISDFVYRYTGKIFLSGRNKIWKEALAIVSESPVIGYGLDYSQLDISVHNSYLNILLQTGIVGILSVFLFVNHILNEIIKKRDALSEKLFIFAIANLLISSAEVMLLQGQLVLQLTIWCMLGLGLNKSYANKKKLYNKEIYK